MDLDDIELKATKELFSIKDKEEKLEELKEDLFMLEMKDHWEFSDFQYETKLLNKIRELENSIDKKEKN